MFCEGKWCGEQNLSMMDRQWKGHCCLSIHLRCTWKSSTMTAHPSDTGVQLSLLEQNQASALSIMHPFCSRYAYFCLLVLQNLAGPLGLMGLLWARPLLSVPHKNKQKRFEGVKTNTSTYGTRMTICEEDVCVCVCVYCIWWREETAGKVNGNPAAVDLIPS